MAPDASDLPVKSIAQELSLPDLSAQIAALEQMVNLTSCSFLVIADSDVRVEPDYLTHVVPSLLERYNSAAGQIATLAVGDMADVVPTDHVFRASPDLSGRRRPP